MYREGERGSRSSPEGHWKESQREGECEEHRVCLEDGNGGWAHVLGGPAPCAFFNLVSETLSHCLPSQFTPYSHNDQDEQQIYTQSDKKKIDR